MSKNSNTVPPKGILRNSHSSKKEVCKGKCSLPASGIPPHDHAHFDEMNILETHHPEGKDYGHMKIDEPKTPYHTYNEPLSEDDSSVDRQKVRRSSVDYNKASNVDPQTLSNKLLDNKQKAVSKSSASSSKGSTDEEDDEHDKEFKMKRAAHYGKEFVKLSEIPPEDDD